MTEVALTTVTDIPAVPSNVTPVVPVKFVPVIVTVAEPPAGPDDGDTEVIVGAATNVYPPVAVAEPPGVVSTTSTAPAALAGVTAVTEVPLTTVTDVAEVPPSVTPVVPVRLVPVIVIVVEPAVGPLAGETNEMVGIAKYVYPPVLVAEPPGVVRTTSRAPAVPDGVVTVTDVAPTMPRVPAAPPIVTPVVPNRFVPVIVTEVPPATGPLAGDTEAIVGIPKYVKPAVAVTEPPDALTTTLTAPAALAGLVTVIDAALELTIVVPGSPPNVTAEVPVKLVPVIVTVVTPAIGPLDGETDVIVGASTNVNADVEATVPPEPVRVTVIVLAATAGVATVIDVALVLTIEVPEALPNVTAEVPVKLSPVIVTVVPPADVPDANPVADNTDVIVGAATNVNPFVAVAVPPAVVKTTLNAPAALGGVTTVSEVELTTVTEIPAVPPNVTPVVPVRAVPVIVTVVPPAVVPDANPVADNTDVIVGAATYV